jgi:hypothetical protein
LHRPRVRLGVKPVKGLPDAAELSVLKRNNVRRGAPVNLHWDDGLMLPDHQADQQRALQDACVSVAKACANGGIPIVRQLKGFGGHCDRVAAICGVRPTPKEMLSLLTDAALAGRLKYREYDKNKRGEDARAGFFPAEPMPWSAATDEGPATEAEPEVQPLLW